MNFSVLHTYTSLYYKLHQLRNFHEAYFGILDSRSVKQTQHSCVSCSTNLKSFNTYEAMNKHYYGDVLILMAVTVYLTSHFKSVLFSFLAPIACWTLLILALLMRTLVRQLWWKVNITELQIFPKQSGSGSPNQYTCDSINNPLLNICQQC